jgi:chemotaxis-related protein WspD
MAKKSNIKIDDCWNHIGVWGNEEPRCEKLESVGHCQNCSVYANSGRQLLDRMPPAGYTKDWTKIFSQKNEDQVDATESAIIFRVGDEWYALNTRLFKEITDMRPIHTLPHTKNRVMRGITNIRGELHICISLGYLLELNKAELSYDSKKKSPERLVVIEQDSDRYVFPVSEIHGIHHFNPEQVAPPPSTISKAASTYITGVIDFNEKRIGCLDAELIFHSLARKIA